MDYFALSLFLSFFIIPLDLTTEFIDFILRNSVNPSLEFPHAKNGLNIAIKHVGHNKKI